MALTQRPVYGARDLVYAILDETSDVAGGTPTYGTVYSIPGLTSISTNPNSSGETLFADDGPRFSAETTGKIQVDFEIADLLPADEARLLGHTYANGTITKKVTDVSPYVAVGFKLLRGVQSGVKVYDYVWIYKGKMQKPSRDNQTKADKINYQKPKLMGEFVAMQANDAWYFGLRTDDTNASSTTITNFFTGVTLPSADVSALTATLAASSGNVVATFAKGSGLSFGIISSSVTANTFQVEDASGPVAGTYTVGTDGTSVTVTFTPTVAFSAGEKVGASINSGIYDKSSVAATPTGKVLTF